MKILRKIDSYIKFGAGEFPELLKRIYEPVRYFFRKIFQRLRYGFPLEQSWDFFDCHSRYCIPRLKHLRNNLNGHPGNLNSVEEWREIIDKMIWAFENPEFEFEYKDGELDWNNGNFQDNMTAERNREFELGEREWRRRHREGLELFALYYLALWD